MESKCIVLVIERTEMYPQLVRGEATGARREDFWSECLDKYRQGILDNFLIDPMLFGSSIRWWLEVLEDYLLSINTNKQVLYLRLPSLVVVSSTQFCDAVGSNRGFGFDNRKGRYAISRGGGRGRHFR
jgi:hypothetical protein